MLVPIYRAMHVPMYSRLQTLAILVQQLRVGAGIRKVLASLQGM